MRCSFESPCFVYRNASGVHAVLGPPAAAKVEQVCSECGFIDQIRPITSKPQEINPFTYDNLLPSFPVLRILLGRNPNSERPVGVIGNKEMRKKFEETVYEVVVHLEDGRVTSIDMADIAGLRVGDRVRVRNNRIEPYQRR